ncbi:Alpha/Beta hydrolase protein [Trametes polyzona]|nr:Alpha/Beta hydrolase protein [Trametes polyzona]
MTRAPHYHILIVLGVPELSATENDYITVFALHGTAFTSAVYEKVISLAGDHGIRFVAINRRDYPGSTPLATEDTSTLTSGSDEQKAAFLRDRGIETATFIDRFVQQFGVPPISRDGKSGGFALLGWSLGNVAALSAVTNIDALPDDARQRWAAGMRALILHEPPTVAIGTPLPPKVWSPQIDQSIPAEHRDAFFAQWVTSYFKHADLSTRDLDAISYILPATFRAPSIYSMSDAQLEKILYLLPASGTDMLFMVFCAAAANASYKKACFDPEVRRLLTKLRVSAITGDATCAFSLSAYWAMEADDEAHGGGMIGFRVIEGVNHFVHWDEPELTLRVFRELL